MPRLDGLEICSVVVFAMQARLLRLLRA